MTEKRRGLHTAARVSTGLAIVLLAVAAAVRMPLDYAPAISIPQVRVALTLPASAAADAAETGARWAVPVETAIRAAGDVEGARGWVGASGVTLDVHFRRGVDPEVKTARIESELAGVRRLLPREAHLEVFPSRQSGGGPSLVIGLIGRQAGDLVEWLADDLRAVPGIHEVQVYGGRSRITTVTLRHSGDAAADAEGVRAAVASLSSAREIGHLQFGSRSIPVSAGAAWGRIEDLPVRLGGAIVPLRSLATVERRRDEPRTLSWLDGRAAVLIAITRDPGVSLLAFDRRAAEAVRSLAMQRGARIEVVWSEAALLRKLLHRLLIAGAAGTVLMAAAGWLIGGWRSISVAAQLPLAVACAVNLLWIGRVPLDVTTLSAAAIAIGVSLPFVMSERFSARGSSLLGSAGLPFAFLLPVAVALGSGRLAPFLRSPAIAFSVASIASVAAAALTRPGKDALLLSHLGRETVIRLSNSAAAPAPGRRQWPGSFGVPLAARLLRESPTVVLVAGTAMWGLLSWFGPVLDPREPDRGDAGELLVRIALPAASTLAQTAEVVGPFSERLRHLDGIRHFWSTAEAGAAFVTIELSSAGRARATTDRLRERLRLQQGGGALLTIEESSSKRAVAMTDDDEEKPQADPDDVRYRVVVRSGTIDDLRLALDRIETRLTDSLGSTRIHPQWDPPTSRIELRPVARSESKVSAVAASLREWTLAPDESRASDGSILRVVPPHAPPSPDVVPSRADLFEHPLQTAAGPMVVASDFIIDPRYVVPRVERELGRFVLPIEMTLRPAPREQLALARADLDRALSLVALPPGTTVTRPPLSAWSFSAEKLRMLALASVVPLLAAAVAATLLDSAGGVALVALPAAFGLALATPLLYATRRSVDELTLLAIAAAVCWVSALASAGAMRALHVSGSLTILRAAAGRFGPAAAGALIAGLLLAGTGISGDRIDDVWSTPLLAGGVVGAGGGVAAAILPAALLLTARDLRRRTRAGARRQRNPEAWREPAVPSLTVRSLSKRYRSGFLALHRIDFELGPGVTGLLGANGAGKTTLLRIMSGLLEPTRGQVLFCGVPVEPENLAGYRQSIGFLPQEFNAYPGFTAAQFLDHWALERGIASSAAREREVIGALQNVRMEQEADRRVRDFSGGMRQRIGIARALLAAPPLLVVDEPTTGLDIESRQQFRSIIHDLGRDRLVVLSTHLTADVEAVAGRLLLLHRGVLRFDGPPSLLVERAAGSAFEAVVDEAEARRLSRIHRLTARVRVRGGIRIRGVTAIGEAAPGTLVEPTLEEAFLSELQRADQSTGHRHRGFAFLGSRGA